MQPFFYVRREKQYEQILFSEILYIKAVRGYVQIVCEKRTILYTNTLNHVMKFLPADLFCRIHHSYTVALDRIREFDRTYVELEPAPANQPYKMGLARITRLPVGGLIYRNNFRAHVPLMKNKSGSHTKTKREAAYQLEDEEIELELSEN